MTRQTGRTRRPHRTRPARPRAAPLHRLLRSELALVVPRPRTAAAIGPLLIIPPLAAFGLRAIGGRAEAALNVLLVCTVDVMAPLLAVPVALVAADAFATERAHRTLDQLRIAPVGTGRLVGIKAAGVLATAALTALVTTLAAALAGLVLLPWGPYSAAATTWRQLAIGAWLAGQLAGVGVLLLAASVAVRRPAGIVAAGVPLSALGLVPGLPPWAVAVLPNGDWARATTGLSAVPADWSTAGATTLRAAVYAVVGAGVAAWLAGRRDG